MKRGALALALLAVTSGAGHSQGRPDSLRMSCNVAASLVRSTGAVVLGTGPNIYDRFVSSKAFCNRDEDTEPRWIPAGDNPQCFIGYVCERRYGDPQSR